MAGEVTRREWPAAGRGVVVTAAAAGIGRAIAERFVANGDKVVGLDVDLAGMQDVGLVAAVQGDAGSEEVILSTLDRARQEIGQLDVLICCAGFGILGQIPDLAVEDWDSMFALNLRGPFLMAKHGIPMLRDVGGGVVINIASQLGLVASPNMAGYCATKGGLIQLTRALALDHAGEGIRVNAICPGPTRSPRMIEYITSAADPVAQEEWLASRTAMNRLLEPNEIAGSALFLASPDASGITGEALVVDAGYTLA